MQRRSIRAFLPDAVDRECIEAILSCARQAPSGANLQPGSFHVLTGDALKDVSHALGDAIAAKRKPVAEYSYFPEHLSAALKARQHDAGFALYEALGIERRDTKARREQFARNYRFFDAPVGIVVTIDRNMGKGCFMDLGMALMNLFTSAHTRGLGTSGIGALANHADVVHTALSLPEDEMVVCGIALGFADVDHPVNTVRTTRESLDSFTTFHGF
ncbi:UNVERIFIED_CONTAM: hypothetical protein GTU68_026268 [Idotea baltica]|nr:hypothetical protein [Idotea baltica]